MTKNDLVKIIREVVKREVKKQVNEILIREQRTSAVSSKKSKRIVRKRPVKKEVNYTSNKTLNKVLNETVGMTKGNGTGEYDEYPDLGDGVFDTSRMTELLGYGADNKEVQREVGAVQTMKDAGVTSDQIPDGVLKALTRDYSDLMKHDKFKGK
jgi:hypothetical protein